MADSTCVDVPRNGVHALSMLKINGEMMTVSDTEIIFAQLCLSRSTGLFTEPAGAAAFAGFQKTAPDLNSQGVIP